MRMSSPSASGRFRQAGRIFSALIVIVISCALSHAQNITGSIMGAVKDETGAMVAGATVKATNVDTGFVRSVPNDAAGGFRLQYMPVGKYSVEVSAPGFKSFVQKNVVLNIDQTQLLNIVLTVGGQTQTVTVTTAPPVVETTTAELGRTVQPEEIIGLPLVNRNAYAEVSLTPGVQVNSASGSNPENPQMGAPSAQIVLNGGIDAGTPMVAYYLDGGLNMTGIRNYGNPIPNPDALQEFRVETSDFSAQYGRMSGGVVTALTKSGTNHFRGSLFEFLRNTNLNATPWNTSMKSPYHRNQFGMTLGGPIKRDKILFFFSYAGLRQTTSQLLTGAVVPTALERTGDFSISKVIPKDPATGLPYAYNGTKGLMPSTALDPTAKAIIAKYIPLPTNTTNNTWSGYFTGPTSQDEFLGKYDQVLSERDHLAVSYFNVKTTQNSLPGGGNLLWSTQQAFARQQNLNASNVHTFGAATANQTWLSFTRVVAGRLDLPAITLGDLGSTFTLQGTPALPNIAVSGYFTLKQGMAGPVSNTDFYQLRDVISTTKGKHTIDYGAEVSLEKDMLVGTLGNYGTFSFATSTAGSTGNALADFVIGKVGSMGQDTPYHGVMNSWYYGFFAQDTYRLRQNLTLSLGLRWDFQLPPTESTDQTATFRVGAKSTKVPTAPAGMLFAGDDGVPRGLVSMEKHHIAPRLGVVWDPFGDGKTAIRAGAGIFFGSVSANQWNQPANSAPFAIRQTFNSITSLTNVYADPTSFPTGNPFPYTYSRSNPRFLPWSNIEVIPQNYKWPLNYQLNAAVERQLPGQVGVTFAYVASLMHNIPFTTDVNYSAWAAGASTSQSSINARRPYGGGALGQIQQYESTQTASYHSLQISARKPLSHSLMLSGYYVISHSFWSNSFNMLGFGNTQDYLYPRQDRGPSDLDRRHTASLSGIWNIDYYHGENRVVKHLANGWTISPIVSIVSGAPINIVTGSDKNADTFATDRPNLVPGVSAFLDPNRSRAQSTKAWFNTAAFTANGPGLGIGVGGADGNTPRDYLRGPGSRNVDLGLLRNFSLTHGVKLQMRAEATNVFNLVNLGNPTASLASSLNGQITGAGAMRVMQMGARITY